MPVHAFQTSFNSGKLTPLMDARVAVEKYANGCRILDNFIVSTHGPATQRPGLEYMGPAGAGIPRLRGLDFSATTSFMLEWNTGFWRFWTDGELVPFTLAHPYADDAIPDIQMAQVNDVIYIVHPDYFPRILERYGDEDWRLRELHEDATSWYPALLDVNTTPLTIAASATTGTGITLTASAALWEAGHVGAYWEIAHRRPDGYREILNTLPPASVDVATPASETIGMRVIGRVHLYSYGIWTATVYVEELQPDGVNWSVVRTWRGAKDRNIIEPLTFEQEATIRLRVSAGTGSSASGTEASPRFLLEAADSMIYGLARITGFTSTTVVTADVKYPLQSTAATPLWTEGAWSAVQGFPRTVCLHGQQTQWGGTLRRPQSLWSSVTGDFENFRRSTLDTGSYFGQIDSENSITINWLLSHGDLLIGTSLKELVMSTPNDSALTPTNRSFRTQSATGSAYRQAILIRDTVVFSTRYNTGLARLAYQDSGRYGVSDISLLAAHLFRSGIRRMFWQAQPASVLWVILNNGHLIGFTYEADQNVYACHEHITDGNFIDGDSMGGEGGDECWFVVERGGVHSIERFEPVTFVEGAIVTDAKRRCHLDAAVFKESGTAFASVAGLGHLEGKTVSIYAGGAEQPQQVVSGGAVTLDPPEKIAWVGLPYELVLQPMKLEIPVGDGTSRGRRFRVNRVILCLLDSLGGDVADSLTSRREKIQYRKVEDLMDNPPPDATEDIEMSIESATRSQVDVVVRHNSAVPFTLVGMVIIVEVFSN